MPSYFPGVILNLVTSGLTAKFADTNNSDIIAKIWFMGGLKLRFKDYC
jgi:hypothetical protein